MAARARGGAGRPGAADARQRGTAVGGHPGHDEARGGDHPGLHAAAAPTWWTGCLAGRSGTSSRMRLARRSSPRCRATGPGSWSTGRRTAGIRTRLRSMRLSRLRPKASPGPMTRCCSTSPGHHGAAQAGRAHESQLPGGAPVHHVLGRHPAGRRAPQPVLAGLGQARLEQRVRAVERGRHRSGAELPAVLGVLAAGRARFVRGDHVLRAAHGVADAHPADSVPRTFPLCGRAWPRASR